MSLNYLFLTLSLMSDIADPGAEAPLTFGQKAVGLTFNPGNNPDVTSAKQSIAFSIDRLDNVRSDPNASPEKKRLCSIAITELQTAQMWEVKAITWKD